ncbi:hypothetical protein NC651_016377 [Populus alba x Populus x berolinensis]|nr:hypothetical protein NC651_016377 [Populus alba x Populus x berolinensis]
MFLNSEMLYDSSSNRFLSLDLKNEESTTNRAIEDEQVLKMKEEIEMKRLFESKGISSHTPRIINSNDRRSISEITAFSRFRNFGLKNTIRESSSDGSNIEAALVANCQRNSYVVPNRERRIRLTENTRQTLDA